MKNFGAQLKLLASRHTTATTTKAALSERFVLRLNLNLSEGTEFLGQDSMPHLVLLLFYSGFWAAPNWEIRSDTDSAASD